MSFMKNTFFLKDI